MTMDPTPRTETDLLGEVTLQAGALYGVNTARGVANLTVSPWPVGREREFVRALALVKKAAALANAELGQLTVGQASAIAAACDEVAQGRWDGQFVVDLMEGSGGTSTNMNANEVIARRAQQIGAAPLHANDHVNRSQSTNDVYPTAMKLAVLRMLGPLVAEVGALACALAARRDEWADVLHLGRTCLQDAQPMRLGQAFGGYAALVQRQAKGLASTRTGLLALPLGGTAIGTGFGSPPGWRDTVLRHLRQLTGEPFEPPGDTFDAMQNLDVFARVSAELRHAATSMARIASDLILLSSGPRGGLTEIRLPAVQAGSSIMPGKVNPVVPMSLVQIGFAVVGNDATVAQAHQAGQLEINHWEPVVASRLFDSLRLVCHGARLLRTHCVEGLQADVQANLAHLTASAALATALIPTLGYDAASLLVKEAQAEGLPLLDVLERRGLMAGADAMDYLRAASQPVPAVP
jgi:aspartate ammonia-lyase